MSGDDELARKFAFFPVKLVSLCPLSLSYLNAENIFMPMSETDTICQF